MDALVLAAALRSREQRHQQQTQQRDYDRAGSQSLALQRHRPEARAAVAAIAALATSVAPWPPPPSSTALAMMATPMSRCSAAESYGGGADATMQYTPSSNPPPSSSWQRHANPRGRFKAFHSDKWMERLAELKLFRKQNGHCLVPHVYPPNPQLARWVKRQRRQYKLMLKGGSRKDEDGGEGAGSSTMTNERVRLLDELGFTWDSHTTSWLDKVSELAAYRRKHGNCAVPSTYKVNPGLAVWVKCQRRQYKLKNEGKASSMSDARVVELEAMGFQWEIKTNAPGSSFSSATAVASTMSMVKSKALPSRPLLPPPRASFSPTLAAKACSRRATHDQGNDMTILAAAAAAESMARARARARIDDSTRPVTTSPPNVREYTEATTTETAARVRTVPPPRGDDHAGRRLLAAMTAAVATPSKARRNGKAETDDDYACLNPDFRRFYHEDIDLLRI